MNLGKDFISSYQVNVCKPGYPHETDVWVVYTSVITVNYVENLEPKSTLFRAAFLKAALIILQRFL